MSANVEVPSDDEMVFLYRKGLAEAMEKLSVALDPILSKNPEFVAKAPPSIQAGVVMHALLVMGAMVAQGNNCSREQVLDIINGIKEDVQDPTSPIFIARTLFAS